MRVTTGRTRTRRETTKDEDNEGKNGDDSSEKWTR